MTKEDLNREFLDAIISDHILNVGRLSDALEVDEQYGEMRWVVRMWYDISEFILMTFPDEELSDVMTAIADFDQCNKGQSDYHHKMVMDLLEYVDKLANKHTVEV